MQELEETKKVDADRLNEIAGYQAKILELTKAIEQAKFEVPTQLLRLFFCFLLTMLPSTPHSLYSWLGYQQIILHPRRCIVR